MTDEIKIQNEGGRPPILDDDKRRKIIAVLANGNSRRVAARVAGCAHSTIARTATRDPKFAAELDAAEHNAEVDALRLIRKAAKKDRYWRAAAWLLERKNPREFARRTPATLSEDDVFNLARYLIDPVVCKMSDEEYDDLQDRLYEMVRAFHDSEDLAKYLPIPPPSPPEYVARNRSDQEPQSYAPPVPGKDEWPKKAWDYETEDDDDGNFCPAEAAAQPAPSPSQVSGLPEGFAP